MPDRQNNSETCSACVCCFRSRPVDFAEEFRDASWKLAYADAAATPS